MTLVIAGHTYEQEIAYAWPAQKKQIKGQLPSMYPSGLFVASDSVLTAHGSTGVSDFLCARRL